MMFTTPTGEQLNVPEEEVAMVENNPNYTVYQATTRTNPGGVLTKVVYNNPRIPLDGMEDSKMNVGGMGTNLPDDFMMQEETGMSEMYDNMNFNSADGRGSEVSSLYGGRSNPPSGGTTGSINAVTWRNLRLQSAIDGESRVKGRVLGRGSQLVKKLSNLGLEDLPYYLTLLA